MSANGDSSPSRGNGLVQVLSRGRRKKNTDTHSLTSENSNSDSHHSLRSHLEGAIDKLKGHDGHEDDNNEHGLGKLLSKGVGSKRRRRKKEMADELRTSEEVARGRSVAERGTLDNDNHSFTAGDEDASSLITYESETESIADGPPPLSTHPSHFGYLTTSSPLVHSATITEGINLEQQVDGTTESPTFSAHSKLASSSSFPVLNSPTLQAPFEGSSKRSASPVGRLKGAFNRRSSSPNTSPERKVGDNEGSGTNLRNIQSASAASRRGSVAARIGAIFPERQAASAATSQPSPERTRITRVPPPLDTKVRPQTPPASEQVAPVIVNTPPTPTETGSPRFGSPNERALPEPPTTSYPNVITSPSGNMISHRRIRSGSATTLGPSKLSNITSAPLTPTLENGSTTPGINLNQQGGFFSSVISAAQNAANTLSNSIANTTLAPGQTRSRSGTQETKDKAIEEVEVESIGENIELGKDTEDKELAVKTLGMGDLNLSHLGISDLNSTSNTPVVAKFPESESRGRSEPTSRDETVNQRPSTFGESFDTASIYQAEEVQSFATPRSAYEPSFPGDQTPPNGSVLEGKGGLGRSSSLRSAIGASSRRKRGSSAATGGTIAAAIVAANSSVAHPIAQQGITPKLTGFAVASKKRNRDFHQLFRSVPDDDYLIEDYSCALQREILAHGRLYVSEGHLCFSSNIFGWVTTLVMSFDEIVSVEKRSTALLFKNGLMISTLHAKNVFASFTSRDSTYDLIVGIWKLGHPSLRSSLNGVRIEDTGGGDKTEKDDGHSQSGSDSEEETEDGDDVYDEDDEDEDGLSLSHADGSVAGSDLVDKIVSRKASAAVVALNGALAEKTSPASPLSDFPGPGNHGPTECIDQESHYDIVVADEIIAAPLGKVYNLMFGPASGNWMSRWLTVEQKCLDLQMEDKRGLTNDNKVRTYSYIKPLNGSIGPKQTKCIITENLDMLDLEKAVSVTMSTQTPDVPSGNVFTTKTKYCLTWAEGNTTRMQMNCVIEWSGKSWLKGPIEKGAKDGQGQFAKDITAALKAAVSSRMRAGTGTGTPGGKKKKNRKGQASKSSAGKKIDGISNSKAASKSSNWGILEPLHGILGPLVDIFTPLLSGNMVYGLLVGLLVAAWFSFGYSRGSGGRDLGFFGTPERIAAYEEIWRREESELWDWLEERVGMERMHDLKGRGDEAKTMEEKLRSEKVSDREMEIAIKVTEEKLRTLKGVVEKKKAAVSSSLSDPPVDVV